MTALDHITQVQLHIRNHGPQVPLYLVDPETNERFDVEVQIRPGGDGVYLALVPVRAAQPVQG